MSNTLCALQNITTDSTSHGPNPAYYHAAVLLPNNQCKIDIACQASMFLLLQNHHFLDLGGSFHAITTSLALVGKVFWESALFAETSYVFLVMHA
jgi:hypothetical protein